MTIAWLVIGTSVPRNAIIAAVTVIFGTVAMMSLGSVLAAIAPSAQAAYGLGLTVFMATIGKGVLPLHAVAALGTPRTQKDIA